MCKRNRPITVLQLSLVADCIPHDMPSMVNGLAQAGATTHITRVLFGESLGSQQVWLYFCEN